MPKKTLLVKIGFDTKSAFAAMNRFRRRMATFRREIGKPFAAATARLLRLGVVLGVAGAAAVAYVTNISGKYEALELRLRTVLGSAKKAQKAFAETFDLFVRSPMHLEPLIEARILLEAFGVTGPKALKSVANAAAIMGRDVRDVVAAIGSLAVRPLRRLGIMAHKDGDRMVATFRDKMGNLHKVAIEGEEQMRRTLLKIFDIKFGGGLDEMAKTWKGAMSTLGGAWEATVRQFGDGVRIHLLPWLIELNTFLIRMGKNRAIADWGMTLGHWLGRGIQYLQAVVIAWKGLSEDTHKQLTFQGKALAGFVVAMKTGFLTPFVNGMALLVGTQAWAFTTMAAGLTALASFFVGQRLGEALARNAAFESMAEKFSLTYVRIQDMTLDFMEIMDQIITDGFVVLDDIITGWFDRFKTVGNVGEALADFLTSPADARYYYWEKLGTAISDFALRDVKALTGAGKKITEFTTTAKGDIDNLKDAWTLRGTQMKKTMEGLDEVARLGSPDPEATKSWEELFQDMKRLMEVKGLSKAVLEAMTPQAILDYIESIGGAIKELPDVPTAAGLGEAAGLTDSITQDIEKMTKMVAPLRGFATGALRAVGAVSATVKRMLPSHRPEAGESEDEEPRPASAAPSGVPLRGAMSGVTPPTPAFRTMTPQAKPRAEGARSALNPYRPTRDYRPKRDYRPTRDYRAMSRQTLADRGVKGTEWQMPMTDAQQALAQAKRQALARGMSSEPWKPRKWAFPAARLFPRPPGPNYDTKTWTNPFTGDPKGASLGPIRPSGATGPLQVARRERESGRSATPPGTRTDNILSKIFQADQERNGFLRELAAKGGLSFA